MLLNLPAQDPQKQCKVQSPCLTWLGKLGSADLLVKAWPISTSQSAAEPTPSRWRSSLAATHSRLLWAHQRLKTGSETALPSVDGATESLQQLPHSAWQWAESMQLTRPRTLAAAATGGIVGGLVAGPIGFGIGEHLFWAAGAGPFAACGQKGGLHVCCGMHGIIVQHSIRPLMPCETMQACFTVWWSSLPG